MFDPEQLITERARAIDASGIRRAFDLAAQLENPVNLSIGQPHFDVPDPVKAAAIQAIERGFNRYTQTQGVADLRRALVDRLKHEFPRTLGAGAGEELRDDLGILITSGVSGGLTLAILACAEAGDEVIVPDPFFVMYKHLVTLAGATPVYVDTYPDFQLTAQRVRPHLTAKTKMLLFNSPSNPTGVVANEANCRELMELCESRGVLLLSDEIYDDFCYEKVRPEDSDADPVCPSPVQFSANALLLRGYSKTYAMTGWRLGYAVGPRAIIEQMTKIQQYSFVCAPSMVQLAGACALDIDMSQRVEEYHRKRDRVVERLRGHYELVTPGGAFYAFPEVPKRLGMTGSRFIERAAERNLLIIPGSVFSGRDTHFRLSYACEDDMLEQGLDILVELAK